VNRSLSVAFRRRLILGRKQMAATKSGGSKRGFAAMDPAKQREIASKGGKASHGGGRKASSHR
jgi:general stress protein YciG